MARERWEVRPEFEAIISSVPDPHKRNGHSNGNGIHQGRNGLYEKSPPPPLGWWREELYDLRPLCREVFPPLKYAVPYLIPEGVTLLVGRPKIRKSWMLLQIACAVAKGDITLTAANGEPPPCGNVLLCDLEGNKRRLQDRVTSYYGSIEHNWPEQFQYRFKWRRLNDGGLDGLGEWCASVPKPRLIVIDTLQRIRPPKHSGQSDYEADMEAAEGLIQLCGQYPGLSIICAHHDRKMDAGDVFDTVSGTLGLQGGVDTIAILKKVGAGVTLYVKGRDLKEEIEKAVQFDNETSRWHILGEAESYRGSEQRARVLTVLSEEPEGATVAELISRAQLVSRNAADLLLFKMRQAGEVERVRRGIYGLPGTRAKLSAAKRGKDEQKEDKPLEL